MKARAILTRCFKARVLSWLTESIQGVIIHGVIVAAYHNGKYIEPQMVVIPDGVPEGWGA